LIYLLEWSKIMTTSDFSLLNVVLKTKLSKSDVAGKAKANDVSSTCIWEPFNSSDCMKILSKHISISLNESRRIFLSQFSEAIYHHDYNGPSVHRRWLFLGDSTMIRSFGPLYHYLTNETVQQYKHYRSSMALKSPCDGYNVRNFNATYKNLNCSYITTNRCDTMDKLQLQRLPSIDQWKVPNYAKGEGPIAYGRHHPYCTDCSGCASHILSCTFVNDDDDDDTQSVDSDRCKTDVIDNDNSSHLISYTGPSYGGYISIEFARDVELQTPEYNTTQENVLSNFIANAWNSPMELVLEFGRPICVVGTGHHDAAIKDITKQVYLRNVQWYLGLLERQCDYIIWVSNSCPATDDYPQKISATYEWNIGVRDMLRRSEKDRSVPSNVFFLDVYNASQTFAHHDNIHMSASWYAELSSFLKNIMQNLTL
jgi:hypothetical protein